MIWEDMQMKAVILAGGLGTRLRPVTGEHPKPMADLLGKPIMEHVVDRLREAGFTELCATLCYRAGEIMAHFGDGRRFGVRMEYRIETEPRGTAGSVKGCRDFCGEEDFLAISADAACDFDLSLLMRFHREKKALASIALCSDPAPLRYGLAVTDGEGRVRAFIEKPDWPRVVTDLVNTGIYVLSPRALDAVPEEGVFDFGRDLFPRLLREGAPIFGRVMEGYWTDIGTPQAYYRCCADALDGRLRLTPGPAFRQETEAGTDSPEEGETALCPCADRARVMGTLSEWMLDMGADYSDGIRLSGEGYSLHISPSAVSSAVRVAVRAADAEFAKSLCASASEVVEKLGM